MTRLIFYALVGYVLMQILRGMIKGLRDDSAQIDDVLVEDPVCKAHVPRSKALRVDRNGKSWFFCSPGCRDAHQAAQG